MRLSVLAAAIGSQPVGGDPDITGIQFDSRRVQAGDLFVAIPGARADGARFTAEAISRGAVAVCALAVVEGVSSIVAPDPRAALATLSATFFGHPSRDLAVIGITGSLGKTSTALLIEQALSASGATVGVIGSLGIRFAGAVIETGMTTPEAPAIQGALRDMAQRGADAAVMEVTSHSLMLRRVGALELAMAAITNIVPDEHLEFHPTPEHYIATKTRIFELLVPGAPVVVNVDDPIARRVTRPLGQRVIDVTMADAPAHVRIRDLRMRAEGSTFTLDVGAVPPDARHRGLSPGSLDLRLPILGRQQVANAAIAATVALLAGGTPAGVSAALANAEPMRRRMEVLRGADPFILDDTVGHPESIEAVFEAVRDMPRRSLHVVYAIRGTRGIAINERNAVALAEGVLATKARLTVTASEDAADARNVVTPEERDAVTTTLRNAGVEFRFQPTLERAVRDARASAGPDDLLLLLGAQGMDRGREFLA